MTIDERMLFVEPPFLDSNVFQHVASHVPSSANPINGLVFSQYELASIQLAHKHTPLTPIWVGGSLHPFTGVGTRYFEGMMNDSWRWNNMLLQEGKARDLKSSLPTINQVGWYLTEEGNISDWAMSEDLRLRYEWYYTEVLKRLYAIKPLPFLFSPWATGNVTPTKAEAFKKTFMGIKVWLKNQHGINADIRVHLQDAVGMGKLTREQAKRWALTLREVVPEIPIKMNVEYFRRLFTGELVPADTENLLHREHFYQTEPGIKIGACWEIRYWYPFLGYYSNHRET